MKSNKLLSVIVPAFRQEATIVKDLNNINRTLSQGLKDYSYEIICIVDGNLDKTYNLVSKLSIPNLKVFSLPQNRGKGYAVRFGMARSKGNLVSFLDAGMEISPASIMMLMSHLEWYNADIIVGSKRHPASRVNYPLTRYILSIGYHYMIKLLFGLSVTDTQSGIKIFKRQVLEKILPRLLVKKYAMDIEMLAVANYLGFKRIYEAPIEVTFDKKTSAINSRVILRMLWDTMAIFYRLKLRRYYDSRNFKKWVVDPELSLN